MTLFDRQQTVLNLWKQRQKVPVPWADALLVNEFHSPDEQAAWQRERLTEVVRSAAASVPYYRNLFTRLEVRAGDIQGPDDLPRLPVLTKHDVIELAEELRAETLPAGERPGRLYRSSGTTGRPVEVLHSQSSEVMFSLLWIRQAWWCGLDPGWTLVDARIPPEVGRGPDGTPNPDGRIVRRPRWRYLGQFFETGPEYAFNITNPADRQVEWLRRLRPQYAVTYPGTLEEWTLASGGTRPVETLEGVLGVGTQLTPSLRRRLEQVCKFPIVQSYGLNEIGKVALRCAAGRYHVHTEHCLVEIVTPEGRPCASGQVGHVLVTALRNSAMPLIRYDTGDLAEAVGGPCPCGRTLPSFGEVAGRLRRYAGLPAGTRERVNALTGAFDSFPPDQLGFLRRYQVHQDRDNRFELRLQTAGPVPEAFREHVRRAWEAVAGTPPVPLTVVVVDAITPSPSGKLLDFSSDLYPDPFVVNPFAEQDR